MNNRKLGRHFGPETRKLTEYRIHKLYSVLIIYSLKQGFNPIIMVYLETDYLILQMLVLYSVWRQYGTWKAIKGTQ